MPKTNRPLKKNTRSQKQLQKSLKIER